VGFAPTVYPHRLEEPLRLKEPAHIFLGSMGDLFDPAFPDEFRDRVFAAVALASWHTFVLLTKQPGNMRRYVTEVVADPQRYTKWASRGAGQARAEGVADTPPPRWPLRNLWLGVTVTNQADADERIPLLLDTPAAVRFVSIEPMLGPANLRWLHYLDFDMDALNGVYGHGPQWQAPTKAKLDWVVVGGRTPGQPLHEQGTHVTRITHPHPGADLIACMEAERDGLPLDEPVVTEHGIVTMQTHGGTWVRSLRDQCAAAGVPFFYKHGGTTPALDGVVYDQFPQAVA
jgi:protein gp37